MHSSWTQLQAQQTLQVVSEPSLHKWTRMETFMPFHSHQDMIDHKKNCSPFLLEAAPAVWGMDIFNEFLKGKQFIFYTDHKPLEKLGQLPNKELHRLQSAMLEHDIIIQYKKGSSMPADYLSRLPATEKTNDIANIAAFNPFQTDLYNLQMKDEMLQTLQKGISSNKWPENLSKLDHNYLHILSERVLQNKNNAEKAQRKSTDKKHREKTQRKSTEKKNREKAQRKSTEKKHKQKAKTKSTDKKHIHKARRKSTEKKHREKEQRKSTEKKHREKEQRKSTEKKHREKEQRKRTEKITEKKH
jgi:hypothetical protein